jgi:hypothetical protein
MYRRPPRRRVTGPRFDGARALDLVLREGEVTVPDFCTTHGIDRFHVDRLLRGQVKRCPPVDIVLAIQRATDGRVAPELWGEETLREDDPGEVPDLAASSPDISEADDSGEHDVATQKPTGTG